MVKLVGQKKSGSGSSTAKEDPNTLTTNTIAKAIFLFSEGPVSGLTTGDGKSIYFNDVPMVDSLGNNNHSGVAWTFRNGLPDQTAIPGIPGASTITNVSTKVTFATPVVQTITGSYDAVNVTVSIPALTAADPNSGALKGTDLSFVIEVKTATGSYVQVYTINLIKQKTTTEYRATYRVDLPTGGSPWSIRIRRLTADSGSVNLQNDLYFATYATLFDAKFTYRNSAVLGLELPAKEFNNQVPTVKALIDGVKVWVPKNYDPVTRTYATTGVGTTGGIWDGTFKAAWSDNPVWVFYDLLINNRYGLGQDFNPNANPDSNFIDKWSLYPISQFCDGMVSDGFGGTEPRYRFNAQITDKQEAYDLLQSILTVLNGMIYFSAEKIYAVADMPDAVDDIYTQADVVDGLFEYSGTALKTRHSAIITYYNDPNQLYKRAAVTYEDADLIDKYGYRALEINSLGCTSRAQALRTAKWVLHTENSQTQTVTFKTGHRGGFLTPGNIIKIFDDYKAGQRMGGRIISATGTSPNITFTLDQSISLVSGDKFLYINTDGLLVTCNISSSISGATIALTNANGLPVSGGTFAVIKPSLDGQLFKVIHIQEDESEIYTVVALEHDETKFAIIDAAVTFDQGPTSIYSIGKLPSITGVTISPWWETVSGTEAFPHISVSWNQMQDNRFVGYQLQLKTPNTDYSFVYDGTATNWDSARLTSSNANDYSVRVRWYDAFGRFSDWTYNTAFSVPGKNTSPAQPTNTSLTSIINGYIVNWDNPQIPDFKCVEVWVGTTNVQASSTLVAQISDDFYTDNTLSVGAVRYVWLRTVTHAATNNTSAFLSLGSVTARGVTNVDLGAGFTAGIPHGSSLPSSGMVQGDLFFLTTDNKLYRYTGSAWTAAVPAVDITGTITNTQIGTNAIDTPQLNANAVTAAKIAALTITANEIAAGTITGNKIQAGTITASLISVSSLSAINANIGTVNAGVIQNSAGTTFFDLTNGRSQYAVGSYVFRLGSIGSTVVGWFGPSSVTIGSETRTNGAFAWGTDGVVYYGSAPLTSGGGTNLNNSNSNGSVTFGLGTGMSTEITTTLTSVPANGIISVTPAVDNCTFSGASPQGTWQVTESTSGLVVGQGNWTGDTTNGYVIFTGRFEGRRSSTPTGSVTYTLQAKHDSGKNYVSSGDVALIVSYSG